MQPAGYSRYWQYTTALAFSVLAATNPPISKADKAIESFISTSHNSEVLRPWPFISAALEPIVDASADNIDIVSSALAPLPTTSI
jgi:hypothetical protein